MTLLNNTELQYPCGTYNSCNAEGFGNIGLLTDLTWNGPSFWAAEWISSKIYKCGIIDGIFKPIKENPVELIYIIGI